MDINFNAIKIVCMPSGVQRYPKATEYWNRVKTSFSNISIQV